MPPARARKILPTQEYGFHHGVVQEQDNLGDPLTLHTKNTAAEISFRIVDLPVRRLARDAKQGRHPISLTDHGVEFYMSLRHPSRQASHQDHPDNLERRIVARQDRTPLHLHLDVLRQKRVGIFPACAAGRCVAATDEFRNKLFRFHGNPLVKVREDENMKVSLTIYSLALR